MSVFKILIACFLAIGFCPDLTAQNEEAPLGSASNYSGVVGSGARAFGMGGAFIAVADDATAASWNPGGLGQLERMECSVVARYQGASYLQAAILDGVQSFYGSYISKSSGYNIDFASLTVPFRLGKLKLVPQISYQRAVNYRSNGISKNIRHWTVTSIDDDKSIKNDGFVDKESLFKRGLDQISFSLGSRLGRLFSFGFTVNYWFNGMKSSLKGNGMYENSVNGQPSEFLVLQTVDSADEFDFKGLNINAGILLTLSERVRIGLVYRSAFSADVTYKAMYRIHQDYLYNDGRQEEYFDFLAFDISDQCRIDWPWSVGVGLAINPLEQLTLSADFTYSRWSDAKFRNIRRELTQGHENGPDYIDLPFPTFHDEQKDSWQIRLGSEYVFMGKGFLLPLRMGLFTDRQFFMDYNQQSISFWGATTGIGFKTGFIALDLAVVYQAGAFIDNPNRVAPLEFTDLRMFFSTIFSF